MEQPQPDSPEPGSLDPETPGTDGQEGDRRDEQGQGQAPSDPTPSGGTNPAAAG